jgi:hypothetical protein
MNNPKKTAFKTIRARREVTELEVQTVLIKDTDVLSSYEKDWNALFSVTKNNPLMNSFPWVISFLKVLINNDQEWACILAFYRKELVGAFPFLQQRIKRHSGNLVSVSVLTDSALPFTGVIIKPGFERKVVHSFLQEIRKINQSLYGIFFSSVRIESPLLKTDLKKLPYFKSLLQQSGYYSRLLIKGDWENYYNSLSSNFRANLRKAKRKLEKAEEYEYIFVKGSKNNRKYFTEFLHLEASGWKGKKGTAIIQNPVYETFYSSLIEELEKRQLLEWHFLLLEGKPIAGHLASNIEGNVTLIKIAYSEEHSKMAPGNLLLMEMIKASYLKGNVLDIDCLTDMQWHKNWNMSSEPLHSVLLFAASPLPYFLGYLPRVVKRYIKKWVV